jgi:hypothetical protein
MNILKKIPFHPVLFAGFCVLALMAYNVHEIAMRNMWSSLMLALLIGISVYMLARLFIHDWHRAALVALAILFFFFTYGQIYNVLANINSQLFRHRNLLGFYGLLLIFTLYWIVRRMAQPKSWTYWLNLLSIYLLIYPTFVVSVSVIQQFSAYRSALRASAVTTQAVDSDRPDIYYIILDSYGRADVLKNYLEYDNSAFIAALQERGFYVADCSQSNYGYTEYSLPSSLNYDYLDHLHASNKVERVAALQQSAVRAFMTEHGYRITAGATSYPMTDWKDADLYLDFDRNYSALPEFEKLVMDTTVLRLISDYNLLDVNRLANSDRRARVLSLLKNLKQLPDEKGDLFVFAHFAVPHNPYQFGPNGEWIDDRPKDFKQAYIGQVIFINREILKVIDAILANSKTPPVIVIQGDHGPLTRLAPTPDRKMPILNAYYLPGVDVDKVLYRSISPVNTFRVILNNYFGQDLPLLEDISYYAPDRQRDKLEVVPQYPCPNQP